MVENVSVQCEIENSKSIVIRKRAVNFKRSADNLNTTVYKTMRCETPDIHDLHKFGSIIEPISEEGSTAEKGTDTP